MLRRFRSYRRFNQVNQSLGQHIALATICGVMLTPSLTSRAWGWGNDGHHIVGYIAEQKLQGTRAWKQAHALLKPGEDLATIATWPDDLKKAQKSHTLTAEMQEFLSDSNYAKENKKHSSFHYTDLPFQRTYYKETFFGAEDNDIVHTMQQCILSLQGKSNRFDKRYALMFLVHLTGDIHQPLHAGGGYIKRVGHGYKFTYATQKLPGVIYDTGGNGLNFTKSKELHAFWDTETVHYLLKANQADDLGYAQVLSSWPEKASWKVNADVTEWPRLWATDSLKLSKQAYSNIEIGSKVQVKKGDWPSDQWKITLPDGYEGWADEQAEIQLAKAGYRLAALLNAIWPDVS